MSQILQRSHQNVGGLRFVQRIGTVHPSMHGRKKDRRPKNQTDMHLTASASDGREDCVSSSVKQMQNDSFSFSLFK